MGRGQQDGRHVAAMLLLAYLQLPSPVGCCQLAAGVAVAAHSSVGAQLCRQAEPGRVPRGSAHTNIAVAACTFTHICTLSRMVALELCRAAHGSGTARVRQSASVDCVRCGPAVVSFSPRCALPLGRVACTDNCVAACSLTFTQLAPCTCA